MDILSKEDEQDDFVGCESAFKSNSTDITALCEKKLVDLIDSNNFYITVITIIQLQLQLLFLCLCDKGTLL